MENTIEVEAEKLFQEYKYVQVQEAIKLRNKISNSLEHTL